MSFAIGVVPPSKINSAATDPDHKMRTEGGPEDVTILPCRLSLPSQERVAGLARLQLPSPTDFY